MRVCIAQSSLRDFFKTLAVWNYSANRVAYQALFKFLIALQVHQEYTTEFFKPLESWDFPVKT